MATTITVLSIEDGADCEMGTTVNVTLTDGVTAIRCDGIAIWEGTGLRATWKDWKQCIADGMEGFTVTTL